MKRLSDEGETVVVNVKVPEKVRDRIDAHKTRRGLPSRSDAARRLIEVGLDNEEETP